MLDSGILVKKKYLIMVAKLERVEKYGAGVDMQIFVIKIV
jgi:hypothetical protein